MWTAYILLVAKAYKVRFISNSSHCFTTILFKQNGESTEGFSKWKVEKRYDKFGKAGLNKWSISKSAKKETEQGVRKGKHSLLACHTLCKYSMETTRNSVKVKHIPSVLIAVKDHVIKYSETAFSNSNVNYFWSIWSIKTPPKSSKSFLSTFPI